MNSNEEGSITKCHKQDSVFTSSKQVMAVISDKVDTIHSCNEPVSHLSSKQVMFVTSSTIHSCSKLDGCLREVKGMGTSKTTSGWRLAAATSTTRSLLVLVGEGHHW